MQGVLILNGNFNFDIDSFFNPIFSQFHKTSNHIGLLFICQIFSKLKHLFALWLQRFVNVHGSLTTDQCGICNTACLLAR